MKPADTVPEEGPGTSPPAAQSEPAEPSPSGRKGLLRRGAGGALSWVVGADTLVMTVLSIFSALVIGALLMIVTNSSTLAAWARFPSNPGGAFATSWSLVAAAYGALLTGSVGSPSAYVHFFTTGSAAAFNTAFNPLSETLVDTAPLLLAGLALTLAFKAGLFNIGGPSQIIAGAIMAGWVGLTMSNLPLAIHMPLALLAGCFGGAVAGWIPGVLRARTGAHEVIVTIMLNYVALNLLVFVLGLQVFLPPGGTNSVSRPILASAMLPLLAGSGLRLNASILIAAAAAVAVAWLLSRTTIGFRFRMVGGSHDAARAAGVDIPRAITLAFVLSGILCGLAGAVMILGISPQLVQNYGGDTGFTAFIIALLGRGKPGGVVLAALLFGAFQAGGLQMQVSTSVPLELIEVIEAVIVFFISAPGLVRAIYRIRVGGGGFRLLSQGWGG
jgi:simple sugar transport system permease protein